VLVAGVFSFFWLGRRQSVQTGGDPAPATSQSLPGSVA
jgi:hypothetical protein